MNIKYSQILDEQENYPAAPAYRNGIIELLRGLNGDSLKRILNNVVDEINREVQIERTEET